MLNCRSCLHRQISSLLSIHAPTARALSFSRPSLARTFEYSNNRRPDSNSRDDRRSSRPAPRPRDRDEPRPKDRMGARGHTDKEPLDPRYVIIPQGIRGGFKKETRDPRDVVIQVEAYLGVGDVAKAHRLVENLSGKIDTVVAWNQLIRRSMDEGKHARAMRFYNDVCHCLPETELVLTGSRR